MAFGLVLKINENVPNRAVIVTTALTLVVFSTIVMGSTVSTLSNVFFKKSDQHYSLMRDDTFHEEQHHPNYGASITKLPGNDDNMGIVKKVDLKYLKPFLIYKLDER